MYSIVKALHTLLVNLLAYQIGEAKYWLAVLVGIFHGQANTGLAQVSLH